MVAALSLAGSVGAWDGAALAPVLPETPAAPHVVGGQAVLDGWPDVAALLEGGNVACNGTLIAPDLVLTAAHCIGSITSVALDWRDTAVLPGETIAVLTQEAHPSWWSTLDVGVLSLASSSTLPPRRIAHGCAAAAYEDGAVATLVGWGATDTAGTVYPDLLMEASLTVTDADCSDTSRGCNAAVSPGGELGAGGGGVDACIGDSGAPLYLGAPASPLLAGITSRSWSDSDPSNPCGDGGIWIRADAVVAWIEAQTGRTLPEPVCHPDLIFDDGLEYGALTPWSAAVGGA